MGTRSQCPKSGERMPAADRSCGPVEQTFHQRMNLSWKESVALMGVHTLGRVNRQNSGFVGWWSDPQNSRIFNNNYFVSLISKGWGAFITRDFPWQWIRSDKEGEKQFNDDGSVNDDNTQIMLDSDLCLAYEVDASIREECCAWTEDTPGGCNSADNCCGTQTHPVFAESSINAGLRPDRNNRCPSIGQPVPEDTSVSGTGDYVRLFADNQNVWMDSFIAAWRKATGNGFVPPEPLTTTTSTSTTTTTTSTSSQETSTTSTTTD